MPEAFPAGGIVVGPEGDAWLLGNDGRVGRLTQTGAFSLVPIAPGNVLHATAARDGGIWFGRSEGSGGPDKVGRIDLNNGVTEFPLPQLYSGPMAIVEADNGDAWFIEYFGDRIGRVTPSGELSEFTLPEESRPRDIAIDAQGDAWFTQEGSRKIGRMDTAGKLKQFELPAGVIPGDIAAALDGRLWFTEGKLGRIGRITPAGRFSEVQLPNSASGVEEVVAGSERNIWYAASGEKPCIGGSSCIKWEPKAPAIVGRIAPTPLRTVIGSGWAGLRRRGTKLRLNCKGGKASERCRGRLRLKRGEKLVGSVHYSLAADQSHLVRIQLKRRAWSMLRTHPRTRVMAVVTAFDGHGSHRGITLIRERQQ
jgi:virginiamycin B lyase